MTTRDQDQQQQPAQHLAKHGPNPNNLRPDDLAAVVALVDCAIAVGYALSVHDGEKVTVRRSRERDVLIAALGTGEEDVVRMTRAEDGRLVGSVVLVYGNADGTTIADVSMGATGTEPVRAAERAARAAARD